MADAGGDSHSPSRERLRAEEDRGCIGDFQGRKRREVYNPHDQVAGEDLVSEMDLTNLQGGTTGTRVESEGHRVVIVQHHLDEEMTTVSCGER